MIRRGSFKHPIIVSQRNSERGFPDLSAESPKQIAPANPALNQTKAASAPLEVQRDATSGAGSRIFSSRRPRLAALGATIDRRWAAFAG
jgi:hypothetical protein